MATKKKAARKTVKRKTTKKVIKPAKKIETKAKETKIFKEYTPIKPPENLVLVTIGKVLQLLGVFALLFGLFNILWPWWAGIIILIALVIIGGAIKKAGRV
ncbi:MAG: hypothetical protein PHG05_01340 [Candidatus Nanoarchaeia archaeon]|nr:hypothetical protein [Candidatus Nanoarchaeia archaeon]